MSAPLIGLPLSAPLAGRLKNKRVLLLDTSATMRDRRAESMRKLGMEVDCAADISEARSWWRADLYSLVLIDMESGLGHRDRFCDDMRRATPPHRFRFWWESLRILPMRRGLSRCRVSRRVPTNQRRGAM